jgi:hypothetical protein
MVHIKFKPCLEREREGFFCEYYFPTNEGRGVITTVPPFSLCIWLGQAGYHRVEISLSKRQE